MQAAPMTMETMPPDATAPRPHWVMRALLVIVALWETFSALFIFPIFFGDLSALPGEGGWTIAAVIALSPFATIAALFFALTGRLRFSVMAIATLNLLDWLRFLSRIGRAGIEFHASLISIYEYASPISVYEFAKVFVFPMLCIAAIVLAARNVRLAAATVMAVTPSVIGGIGWLVFVIVVSIYGF